MKELFTRRSRTTNLSVKLFLGLVLVVFLGVAAAGTVGTIAAFTVVADIATAPVVEVVAADVAWERIIHFEVKEERRAQVSCNIPTQPLAARLPRRSPLLDNKRDRRCYATLFRWWPEEEREFGLGRDRAWPSFKAKRCDREGCTRFVGRDQTLFVVVPSFLGTKLCPVDMATWKQVKPGHRVRVRRSRLLGLTHCEGLAAAKGR